MDAHVYRHVCVYVRQGVVFTEPFWRSFPSCSEIMRGALAERGLDLSRKLTGGGVCLRTWTGIYTGRGALATRPVSPRIPHRQVVECVDVNTLRRPGEPEASSCFALLSL